MVEWLSRDDFQSDFAAKRHGRARERGQGDGRIFLIEDAANCGPTGPQGFSELGHADVLTFHLPCEGGSNDLFQGRCFDLFVDAFFAKKFVKVTSDVLMVFGLQVFSFWLNRVRDLGSCVSFL